jgi:xanthosine utilization system XapX-like protein
MKNLSIYLISIATMLLVGCITTQTNLVQDALPAIPMAVSIAGTLALNLGVKDASQRQIISNQMYAVAVAIRSLAGGTAPTPDSVKNAVSSFTGKDPSIDGVVNAIGSIWAAYYPSIKGDPSLALQFLEEIAKGSEQAAKNVGNIQ